MSWAVRAFAVAGLGLLVVTCRDGMEPQVHMAPVAVAPILPSDAALASFGLTLDRVRFIVVRPTVPPDTLADTTVTLPPDSATLDLDLHVALIAAAETLEVSVVALSGTIPLFQGTASVEVHSGAEPTAPTDIPVTTYVGPGAGVDSIAVSPPLPFIYFNDSLRFQVEAFQAGVPVTQFYVAWTTSDTTVAKVNGTGMLRAPAARTSVRVIARTPNGAAGDSTTATFLPKPNQLLIIAGSGQTAPAGQALGTQLEVEVRAADNLPVPGVDVRFRSLSGGTPADTIVTSDAQGRASVSGVLGATPGIQTFQASLPGFPSVPFAAFSATATGIVISPATSVITVSSGSVISGATAKLRLQAKDPSGADITTGGATVVLRLQAKDPSGADITTGGATVVFNRSGGSSTGSIGVTADSGNGVYTAVFTGALAGTATTIGATINGAPVTSTLPTIAVSPGAVSPAGSVVTVSTGTVASGAAVTLRLRAKDAAGNNVATGGDAVAFSFSGGTSTGAIGATADSGNGVYTAPFTGVLAGTGTSIGASINGSPVTTPKPSVVVTPGAPAQLAFGAAPGAVLTGVVFSSPVQVTAHDLAGNVTPAFAGDVTIAIGTNPGSAALAGTLTQTASAGVATFNDLAIDLPGIGYTLSATSAGLASDTTASFDVIAPTGQIFWANTSGGNWSNPANWSGGIVPGPSDIAAIMLPGTYTVTLDVNDTIAGLQIGASSGTQTLAAASRLLHVSGTTQLNPNGVLALGASTLAGGTLSSSGTLQITGSSTVSTGIVTTGTSLIRVLGNNIYGQGFLTVANGFVNNGAIVLTDTNSTYGATLSMPAGATLTIGSSGTLQSAVGALGTRTLTAEIDNQGTVTLDRPLTINRASAVHANSGTINIVGGDLTLSQSGGGASFFTNGTITIAAGQSLAVSGGAFAYTAGSISGAGTLSLTNTSATIVPTLSTGAVGVSLASTTVGGPGTLDVAGTTSLVIRASTINSPFANHGFVTFNGSSTLNGTIVNDGTATLRIQGNNIYGQAFLTVANSFTNGGAIVLTDTNSTYGATLSLNAGATLTNTGTIEAATGAAGGRTLTAALDNQGTVTLNRPLTINRADAAHTNSGTIDVTGGDLTLSQSGASPSFTMAGSGVVNVAPSRTFAINGGALNYNAGSISGGGTLVITNTAVTSTQGFNTATAALSLISSTWGGAGALTVSPSTVLDVRSSTISAPLVNQAAIYVTGSSTFNGGFSNPSAATLRIQGNNIYGQSTLTVGTSFTNGGAIVLTDTSSSYGATLTMPVGTTLTNAAGATIDAATGSAGSRTLTVALDNQGSVTVNRPLTLNRASAAHLNSGTIDLSGGDFTLSQTGTSPSFTTSGSILIGSGRTFAVTGGAFNYSAGAITGGTLSVTSATVTATQNFNTATAALNIVSSTWGGTGTLTVDPATTLLLRASTVTAPLVNDGLLTASGSSAINGSFANDTSGTLRVQGDGTYGHSTVTFANGFTNAGAIELTDITSSYGSTLNVTAGTLVNAAGGTITALLGSNGSRNLNAQIDNQGTLTVATAPNQGLTLAKAGADHVNSGTIALTGGDLIVSQSGTTPSFTNTGGISVAVGDTFRVNNGTFSHDGGSIGGAGALSLSSVTAATFNVAHSIASMLITSSTASFTTPQSTGATGFQFASSTINGPGLLTNTAGRSLNVRASTINADLDNQGTLLVNGSSTFNGALTTAASSLIQVQGNGTYSTGTMTVLNGFTNNGAIDLSDIVSSYGATLNVTNGTLTNAPGATIAALVGTNGPRTLGAQIDNQGTINVMSAANQGLTLAKAGADHQNSGTIAITGGDLAISQSGTTPSFTTTGAITVAAGDTLRVSNGAFSYDGGSIGGAGALSLSSVTAATFNLAHSIASMLITSSTASFATPQSTGATGFQFISSTINGPGLLTNDPTRFLNVRASTINADLDNQGTLLVNGSSSFNGVLTTSGTSLIQVQGNGTYSTGTMTVANGFTNNGAIELSDIVSTYGATLNVTSGALTNAPGATITALTGTNGPRTLGAALDNQGTLTVATAAAQALTLNKAGADHLNSGTIDITSGDLTISQTGTTPSFTNDGAITIGTGDTLRVTGGAFTLNTGTLGGGGALSLSSVNPATFNIAHGVSAMLVSSSTVTFATPQTTGATGFSFTSSTINGPGSLTNDVGKTLDLRSTTVNAPFSNLGTLLIHGSSVANDTLTTAAGSLIRIQGNGTFSTGTFTVAKGFENAGTVELTDTTSTYGATLAVPNGAFVNLPGALVNVVAGAAGPRTLTAKLDNQGTLAVALAPGRTLTINGASASHSNAGTINVTGGDLTISQTGTSPSFTNLGAMTIGGGDTLTVTGGTFTYGAGSLDGPGTMVISNVNPANFAKPHTLGRINVTSSTVTFATDQSTANTAFDLTGSVFNGPGILTNAAGKTLPLHSVVMNAPFDNQGTVLTTGATTIAGAVNTGPASLIRIQGSGTYGSSGLTVSSAGGLINNGTIELTDTTSTYGASLTVSNGALRNATGATIDAALGANGPRTLTVMLDNQGTVTAGKALSINGANAAHTNSGLIKVSGGDVTVTQSGGNPSFTNQAGGTIDINTSRIFKVTAGTVANALGGQIVGTGLLDVNAAVFTNDGDILPGGSPGVLSIAGNVAWGTSGRLIIDIAGPAVGTQYDRLAITGSSVLAGTINVSLTFTPSAGQTFDVMTCSVTCTNRFGTENLPGGWQAAQYIPSPGVVRLTAP